MPGLETAIALFLSGVSVGPPTAAAAAIASAITTVGTSLLASTAIGLVSSAILPKAKMPDLDLASLARGRQEMIRQPIVAWRTIYGEELVSGPIAYMESYGTNNEFLSIIIVLAAHECEGFVEYMFDDEVVEFDPVTRAITTPRYIKAGEPYAWLYPHLGADDQAADAELVANSAGRWTVNHRGRGVAYVHVKLRWDQDVWPGDLPLVRVRVRGKKLLDIRDASTAWSQNPMLAIRDYVKTKLNLDDAELNDNLHVASANVCDEQVALAAGGTEARYTLNGTVDDDQRPGDVLQAMLSAMAGTPVYTGGVFEFHAGAAATPTVSLSADDLAGAIEIVPRITRAELFNAVRPIYIDPDKHDQPIPATMVTNATYEAQDNDRRLTETIEFPFEHRQTAAQRLGKIELERARQQITFHARFKPKALRLKGWSTFEFSHPSYGWVDKQFRVARMAVNDDLSVDVTAREEAAAVWSWSAEETVVDPAPDTNLPNPFTIDAPIAVMIANDAIIEEDGTVVPRLKVTWTDGANVAFLDRHDVQYRKVGATDWEPAPSVPAGQTAGFVVGVQSGVDYEARVRAVNALEKKSDWTSSSQTAEGDQVAPGVPTSPARAQLIQGIRVTWTNPVDADFYATKIYRRTATGQPTGADFLTAVPGTPGEKMQWLDGGVGAGTTFFYWVSSVDRSGNESAPVNAGAGITARNVGTTDLQDGAATEPKIGTGAVTNPKIGTNAVSTPKIQANAVTVKASAVTDGTIGGISSSYVTVQTVAFAATGTEDVFLHFHAVYTVQAPVSHNVQAFYKILRDGAEWYSEEPLAFANAGNTFEVSWGISTRDSPSAGNHTYALQIRAGTGTFPGTAAARKRAVLALETKR